MPEKKNKTVMHQLCSLLDQRLLPRYDLSFVVFLYPLAVSIALYFFFFFLHPSSLLALFFFFIFVA